MLKITLPYLSFEYDVDFLLTKQSILHKSIWRYSFYVHICTSVFVLLAGAFQFYKTNTARMKQLHRIVGKSYVVLVLFFAAPSGLIMGCYANGGIYSKISFVSISILWWVFTLLAFLKAKEKDFISHKNYMYRSYALTLSAISLRTYALLLPYFFQLHSREMYTLIAWLSWVPNLLIAELIIYKNSVKD
jgi:uncharacterized membrane protein